MDVCSISIIMHDILHHCGCRWDYRLRMCVHIWSHFRPSKLCRNACIFKLYFYLHSLKCYTQYWLSTLYLHCYCLQKFINIVQCYFKVCVSFPIMGRVFIWMCRSQVAFYLVAILFLFKKKKKCNQIFRLNIKIYILKNKI